MVGRILNMLSQYLVSNQTLKLNKTFKLYLKILSIDSAKFKNYNSLKKTSKRTPAFYLSRKKPVGSRVKATKQFNYFWALDVPNSFPKALEKDIFKDKCLLTACILGILQNNFYKTKTDKRYQKVQYINSTLVSHKNIAGKVLLAELMDLFSKTNLQTVGPYELESTAQILSEFYKCQIIVFDGISNSKKISFMYPAVYNDALIPIYLFAPLECPLHFVFIRHLNSYFKSNLKVCFGCHKTFKGSSMPIKHLCPKKATCFSCRRFFQSTTTYINDALKKQFCDKNVSGEIPFECAKCNVTLHSQHCFLGHKLFCYDKNLSFGMKCKICNVFTYKNSSPTNIINHKCGELKKCKYCFESQEPNHLCKLKKDFVNKNWPRIGFIGSASHNNLPEKCYFCTPTQKCSEHSIIEKDFDFNLFLIFVYREEKERGQFTKYAISTDLMTYEKEEKIISYQYYKNFEKYPFQKYNKAQKKTTDFERNYEQLMSKDDSTLICQILKLTMDKDFSNTTYICQNSDSTTFVSESQNKVTKFGWS
jgi:hypothetical protein